MCTLNNLSMACISLDPKTLQTLIIAFMHADAIGLSSAYFGEGVGTIHIDSVSCSGAEGQLIDCSRSSTVTCYNGHSEDAGVRCQIEGLFY